MAGMESATALCFITRIGSVPRFVVDLCEDGGVGPVPASEVYDPQIRRVDVWGLDAAHRGGGFGAAAAS